MQQKRFLPTSSIFILPHHPFPFLCLDFVLFLAGSDCLQNQNSPTKSGYSKGLCGRLCNLHNILIYSYLQIAFKKNLEL